MKFLDLFPLLTPNTLYACVALYALLTLSQLIVWVKTMANPQGKFADLNTRLRAWWLIFGAFTIIFLTRLWCLHLFWMAISLLALREYFAVIPKKEEHERVRLWLYLSIPIQYTFILTESYGLFLVFIPVYVYLLFPLRMIIVGATDGFLPAMGIMFWGIMMAGYSLGHVAYLSILATNIHLPAGPLGLMLYLLFITEMNDAAQYIWGKLFGKHKVVPTISPKKTVEGLVGGMLTSIAFSMIIAPYLTSMDHAMAALMGGLISLGGFFGDVTMSAIKRDAHVKDFGTLLPGHGGLLDRIDSLIFTGPIFFHITKFLA